MVSEIYNDFLNSGYFLQDLFVQENNDVDSDYNDFFMKDN